MTTTRVIPGINIQWPWSRLLLSGKKTVETRSYPIPAKYIGQELAIIETPGPLGRKNGEIKTARIIGTVTFGASYQYKNLSHWKREAHLHGVSPDDRQYRFKSNSPKWAWPVLTIKQTSQALPPPKPRGIVFARQCEL